MLQGGILQYFRPSLSYHLSLRPLFCLFLSGRFTHVLLYRVLALTLVHTFNMLQNSIRAPIQIFISSEHSNKTSTQ